MWVKFFAIALTLTMVQNVYADLNDLYKPSKGEKLAECTEQRIPLVDRTAVKNIRSYTKYDKHYVALNSASIYVEYNRNNALNIVYVNNEHIERVTTAESAKNTLQNIRNLLVQPALQYCGKKLAINDKVEFSMVYVDPPYESRNAKNVIIMDASGKFSLP